MGHRHLREVSELFLQTGPLGHDVREGIPSGAYSGSAKRGKSEPGLVPLRLPLLLAKSGNPGRVRSASLHIATERKPRNPVTMKSLGTFVGPSRRVRVEPGVSVHKRIASLWRIAPPCPCAARSVKRLARRRRRPVARPFTLRPRRGCRGAEAGRRRSTVRSGNAAAGGQQDPLSRQGL